jgi:C-terminal processing protease CtpA/Prc
MPGSTNVGIGCAISARDGNLCVTGIVPTGPAALSGALAVGDIVVAIDGTAVGGGDK